MAGGGGGGCWSEIPPFRFKPVTKVPFRDAETAQGILLYDLVIRCERGVGLYFGFQPKSVIIIWSEGIFTIE